MKSKFIACLIVLCIVLNSAFGQAKAIMYYTSTNGSESYRTLIFQFDNEMIGRTILKVGSKSNYYEGKFKVVRKPAYAPNDLVYYGESFRPIGNSDLEWADISFVYANLTSENKYSGVFMYWNSYLKDNKDTDGEITSTYKRFNNLSELATSNIKIEEFFHATDPFLNRIKGVQQSNTVTSNQSTNAQQNAQQSTTGGKININVIFVGATNDRQIGRSVAEDSLQLRTMMETYFPSNDAKYNLVYTSLTGANFNREKVVNAINNVKPNPNDVIFFYCSSHGVNKGKNNFPDIAFNADATSSLNLVDIQNALNKKNNRLNFVIGDMCNNVMEYDEDDENGFNRGMYKYNRNNLNKLFEQARGSIVSASAQKFEYSWNVKNSGGQFTTNYVRVLKDVLSSRPELKLACDWNVIFKETYKSAYNGTKKKKNQDGSFGQNGFNIIDIKYN